jgi:hypothetical protein
MRTFLGALAMLFGGVGVMPNASAGFLVYKDETAFLNTGRVVSTETFDEFGVDQVLGGPGVVVDGVTYTSDVPNALWRTHLVGYERSRGAARGSEGNRNP